MSKHVIIPLSMSMVWMALIKVCDWEHMVAEWSVCVTCFSHTEGAQGEIAEVCHAVS